MTEEGSLLRYCDQRAFIEEVKTKSDFESPIQTEPGDRLITTHSTELSHASEVLLNSKIEKLPVVDDKGAFIGIVTRSSILKYFQERFFPEQA